MQPPRILRGGMPRLHGRQAYGRGTGTYAGVATGSGIVPPGSSLRVPVYDYHNYRGTAWLEFDQGTAYCVRVSDEGPVETEIHQSCGVGPWENE